MLPARRVLQGVLRLTGGNRSKHHTKYAIRPVCCLCHHLPQTDRNLAFILVYPTILRIMVQNHRMIRCALVLALLGGALGCQPPASAPFLYQTPVVQVATETSPDAPAPSSLRDAYADSLAMRVYEAAGGPEAWEALPYLRFNFSVVRQNERGRVIRHMWNRQTGDYRVELPGPANEPYVVLFNINTREGHVYWDGNELDPVESPAHLETAYSRFINDTYWLLLPFKLFDPGVNRTYLPDSSNALYDVLHLSFGNVGLTPGDQYWLYADKASGRLVRWSYQLQDDAPDMPPRSFVWEDYEEHITPAGSLFFATRKRGIGVPFAILTDEIGTPTLVPDDMFTAIEARLTPVDPDADVFDAGGKPQPARPKKNNK